MPYAQGGAKIRNARMRSIKGTLGCVVRARAAPQQRYILSAAHVLALNGYAQPGDAIEYEADDGSWTKIAEFERFAAFRSSGALQVCDAAIARITNDALVDGEIKGVGAPRAVSDLLYKGMKLKFHGAISGLKEDAELHSEGNDVPVLCDDLLGGGQFELKFGQQILYGKRSGASWYPATQSGDSGALVLNHDDLAVGLHIAVPRDSFEVKISVCTPIQVVLDALGVELVTSAAGASSAPAYSSADEVGQKSFDTLGASIRALLEPHNPYGGVTWQLSRDGLIVGGMLDRTAGKLVTVPRVWRDFGDSICAYAKQYNVPVELIVATICAESGGNPVAFRNEPKWIDDDTTPEQVSVGLMQTLISTARETLRDPRIDRAALRDPDLSIRAGTAYIDRQRGATRLDPPLVACAYNAGSLKPNDGAANRWKLKQYPIGSGEHADRFVKWFNDCTAFMLEQPKAVPADIPSFFQLLRGG